jgi:PIN domain nuclease of toxin-antitoxin system
VRLLLDTHALLWWFADDDRLGQTARTAIADPQNDVFVSIVTLWEIIVKQRVGKLRADIAELGEAISRQGFATLNIRQAHLMTLASLPMHHRDPFDHLLIAQAIAEDAVLVSDDRYTHFYPVSFLACSG